MTRLLMEHFEGNPLKLAKTICNKEEMNERKKKETQAAAILMFVLCQGLDAFQSGSFWRLLALISL